MSLIAVKRPDWLSTVQTAYVATTSMMPAAIENRNDVFITDHGSNRDSRSRALRVRRGIPAFGLPAARASGATAVDPTPDAPGVGTANGSALGPVGVPTGGLTTGVLDGVGERYSGGAAPPPIVVAGAPEIS